MATRLTPAKRKSEALTLLDSPQISALFEKARLAVDVPIEPAAARRPSQLPSVIGIGLLCAISWWCFAGLRSGGLRATLPGGSHAASTAIGDTCLYRGDFFPADGIQTLRQLNALKGNAGGGTASGLVARGSAFVVLCNWFTSAFDSYYAPLALNLVLCWLCAWILSRATSVLFHDRAKAAVAATCFSLSIAATFSVGDFGPRMLGLGLSYLWTLLLLTKDADDARLGWRGSIGLAALLGFWSLVDQSSLAGLLVFAAFAIKRRTPAPLLLAALSWCLSPLVQELVWRRLGFAAVPNAELALFASALRQHASRIAADPLAYAGFLTLELGNLVLDENPLLVGVCLVGLGVLSHKSKWLLRVSFVVPILVQLVLLPTTRERGAAVAGNTIVIFVLAAHFGVEAGRRLQAKFGAGLASGPVLALLLAQVTWGYSSLGGWNFPASAFATGVFREAGKIEPTKFARLSGSPQEIPTVLGGPVRAPRFCGVVKDQARPPILPRERVAPYRENWKGLPAFERLGEAQAPVLAALLVATLCLMPLWRGLGTVVLFTGAAAGALLCGSTTGFASRSFVTFDDRIAIHEDQKLVGGVQLSPESLAGLQEAVEQGGELECFVRLRAVNPAAEHPAEFQVLEWSSDEARLTVPSHDFLDALRARGGCVEFSVTPASTSKGLLVHSWQMTRPRGERSAQLVHADGSQDALDCFPSFEIRVVRAGRAIAWQNVIERYEPLESSNYSLVAY